MFPAPPLITGSMRATYGNLHMKGPTSHFIKDQKEELCFPPPPFFLHGTDEVPRHACPTSQERAAEKKTLACCRETRKGLQYFPASARLDKIELFPPSPVPVFLLSNAGFSNNTRFYCGQHIMQQISNSCQTRCDRIQWLSSH